MSEQSWFTKRVHKIELKLKWQNCPERLTVLVNRTKRSPLGNTSKYDNRDIDIDTVRLKDFKKVPDFGDTIFVCNTCGKERIYGQGEPDNKQPFLLCEGTCKGHTLHKFYRMIRGRLERYVGVPSYS